MTAKNVLFLIALAYALSGCGVSGLRKSVRDKFQGISSGLQSTTTGEYDVRFAKVDSPPGTEAKQDNKPPLLTRMVIMTGSMNLEVKVFDPVYEKVMNLSKEMNGYVSSSSVNKDTETGAKSGSVVLRIPTKNFEKAVVEVEKLGVVTSKEVKGEDVTEEYVDLSSRLKNLTAEEEQYLSIMKRAYKIIDMLAVEQQLERVRGEIERITGRMKYLRAMVEYSTLTVNLYERALPSLPLSFWNLPVTFREALSAFLTVVRGIIRFLIWLAVFSPFWAGVIFGWKFLKGRKE